MVRVRRSSMVISLLVLVKAQSALDLVAYTTTGLVVLLAAELVGDGLSVKC